MISEELFSASSSSSSPSSSSSSFDFSEQEESDFDLPDENNNIPNVPDANAAHNAIVPGAPAYEPPAAAVAAAQAVVAAAAALANHGARPRPVMGALRPSQAAERPRPFARRRDSTEARVPSADFLARRLMGLRAKQHAMTVR